MRQPPGPVRSGRRPTRVLAAIVGTAVAAGTIAACGRTHRTAGPVGGSASPAATIVIKNFAFHPASLTVNPGVTVTVHNEDPTTHTVTAIAPHNMAFNTGDIAPNATATFTAPAMAGSYPYICLIHQFMHGTLVVR